MPCVAACWVGELTVGHSGLQLVPLLTSCLPAEVVGHDMREEVKCEK